MKHRSFLDTFGILFILSVVAGVVATPLLHNQVRDVVFNLNLEKNREQAERIATLASIDLERGDTPERVLSRIQTMLEQTPQSSEHFACVIEAENRVIAHPKRSDINKDVTGWTIHSDVEKKAYTQSAGEGVHFGGVQTRLDGSQDISYQVPISTVPWSVCVHTKLDLVDQQASLILRRIGAIVLPALLLILVLSSLLITRTRQAKATVSIDQAAG